jgi:hypothetical protein
MPVTPIGSDYDVGGCIISAGYSWCEILGRCVREWIDRCEYPPNCLTFYDGCNTCNIVKGALGVCTEMMCFTRNNPECVVWSPDTVSTMPVIDYAPVINPFLSDGH